MTAAAPADLAAFYADQHDRIFATLVLLVRDRSVAEELAQETFVRVCERWHRVRELDRPGAWAHRVAVNLALSKHRRRQAERRALARLTPADRAAGPVERDPELLDALADLPEGERAVLVLRFVADLSVARTAASLGLPEGTVKTRTRTGLARLREAGVGVEPDVASEGAGATSPRTNEVMP